MTRIQRLAEGIAIAALLCTAAAILWSTLRSDPDVSPRREVAKIVEPKRDPGLANAIALPPPPAAPSPATVPAKAEATAPMQAVIPLKPSATPPEPKPSLIPLRPTPQPVAPPHASSAPESPEPVPSEPVSPDPIAAPPEPVPTITPDAVAERDGRAILRLLEHGDGPTLRIAWPAAPAGREALYRLLTRCYGMRSLLMGPGGALFAETTAPDLTRYSGFLRAAEGAGTAAETAALRPIRALHGAAAQSARTVRAFPRRTDAVLLGGLSQLIGGGLSGNAIDARYAFEGDTVFLTDIRRDGQKVPGRVSLAAAARCGGPA